jgi:F420-dependent oxidoreductase-like protein
VKLGIIMEPRHGATYDRISALARAAEAAGFVAFMRNDHYMGIDPADAGYQPTDSWTTLAGVARDTERVELGTLVTAATFRHPSVLAIAVACVDQASGGRAVLGIGTGWYEREHEAFGIPFPPIGERFDRLEEALAIIDGLWSTPSGETFSHDGRFWSLDACANFPALVSRPRPRIVIGGTGPRRTPRVAARWADEFNSGSTVGCRERFDVVRAACEAIDRDPATMRWSVICPIICGATQAEADARLQRLGEPGRRMLTHGVCGTPQMVVEYLADQAAQGSDIAYVHIYDIDDLEHVALIGAEVLPHIDTH